MHKVIAGHILNGIALRKTVVCTVSVVFELQLVSLDCTHTHTILPMHPVLYHTVSNYQPHRQSKKILLATVAHIAYCPPGLEGLGWRGLSRVSHKEVMDQ